jgi:hypothetical protein
MKEAPPPIVCIGCSILRREIQHLTQTKQWDVPCRFLGSMLHMAPEQLEVGLEASLAGARHEGLVVVLAYGDCCPRMEDLSSAKDVSRTKGINCCEVLLGKETYHRMRREGAFFLLPEWTLDWKRVFKNELGLEGSNARMFMQEMHTRLVYLDTGLAPVPQTELDELADYAGLPIEILPISLEHLLASLKAAVAKVNQHG